MKTSDLKAGLTYRIDYYEQLPSIYATSGGPKAKRGVGKLLKINDGRYGWHSFMVDSRKVWAASRSILTTVRTGPIEDKIVEVPTAEVEKLVQLGFDDAARKDAVNSLITSLNGLGIQASSDDRYTGITIPYAGLASLKVLVHTLYAKSLERDLEELDEWH